MRLAEGLALRADAARRVEQLRSRIAGSARYQEGEEPPEDAAALLAEAGAALDELQILIRRINRTNAAAQIGADGTITDALARRDVLRLRHALVTTAADAAAGNSHGGIARQRRSELKMLAACRSRSCVRRRTRSPVSCASSMSAFSARTGRSTCWTDG